MKYGLFFAIISLTACPSKSKVEDKKSKTEVEKKVANVSDKAPIKEILLSESGVGRVGPGTAFDLETIQGAFGGYTIKESEGSFEGVTYKTFLVQEEGNDILEISSDTKKKVTQIIVKSSKVNNQVGARVGKTFESIFPKSEKTDCVLGDDDLEYHYVCSVPKTRNLEYHFETNEKGKVTPDGDWVLTSIEWRSILVR